MLVPLAVRLYYEERSIGGETLGGDLNPVIKGQALFKASRFPMNAEHLPISMNCCFFLEMRRRACLQQAIKK